ncbi:Trafficking protein particle complex subunit 13 [Dermatophagoides farinae]|uniref:Trafficking protein particle complex subunit 13 n=1 Tax=Dermatophagoides farinae TaxID=6954 RepID=A0A922L885_DERFA|nr:Trafficking protein particle complex subunit 13 [Dermatophagoides farinae]
MEIKPENLLSVRVARVVSRKTDVSSFITADEYNHYFSNPTIDNIILPDQYKNDWIIVPNPYNTIYLGEIFSLFINCTNDSIQELMTNVSVRIDMQINNRAVVLKELNIEKLDAKANLDEILSYEIKEPHIHVLICTLSFDLPDHERQSCRKFFQFQISKPIDVKTKFYYTECDEIYLEAMFQNSTNLPIQLKSVQFDSVNFDVTSLNFNLECKDQWIFGEINRLNPNELRQYLFVLTPKKDIRFNPSILKSVNTIGKLDIIWYSGIGEKGHIQTSQLERNATVENIKVYIEDIPTQTKLKEIFRIKFRIINFSSKTVEPLVNYVNDENQNILWLGLSSKNLGELKQSQSIEVQMNLYPIKIGLFSIPIIKITDMITQKIIEFKDLASVNII